MTIAFSAVRAVPMVRAGVCAGGVSMVAPSRTVNLTVAIELSVALVAVTVTVTASTLTTLAAPVMAQELLELTTTARPIGRLSDAAQPSACTAPPVLANTTPSAASSLVSVIGSRLAKTGAVSAVVGVAVAAFPPPPPQAARTTVTVAISNARKAAGSAFVLLICVAACARRDCGPMVDVQS